MTFLQLVLSHTKHFRQYAMQSGNYVRAGTVRYTFVFSSLLLSSRSSWSRRTKSLYIDLITTITDDNFIHKE